MKTSFSYSDYDFSFGSSSFIPDLFNLYIKKGCAPLYYNGLFCGNLYTDDAIIPKKDNPVARIKRKEFEELLSREYKDDILSYISQNNKLTKKQRRGLFLNGSMFFLLIFLQACSFGLVSLFLATIKSLVAVYGLFYKDTGSLNKKITKTTDFVQSKRTILIPLYKEKKVIKQLIQAIKNLSFNKKNLDVNFLIEQEDVETKKELQAENCEKIGNIRIIPKSYPKNKPKALNYGLLFAKGDIVTVYDAEDIPHPDQILESDQILFFDNEIAAVQNPLIVESDKSWVQTMFSIEYFFQFKYLWPLWKYFLKKSFVPLGGTSNHIRFWSLMKLSGWNSHNVTEDMEIAMRTYSELNSNIKMGRLETIEESPKNIKNLIQQRTRWIKGHLLSAITNSLNLITFSPNTNSSFRSKPIFYLANFVSILLFLINAIYYHIDQYVLIYIIFSGLYKIHNGASNHQNVFWIAHTAYALLMFLSIFIFIPTLCLIKTKRHKKLKFYTPAYVFSYFFYLSIHTLSLIRSISQIVFDFKNISKWEKTEHFGQSKSIN